MMTDAEHRKQVKHDDIPGDAHLLTFSCYRRLPLLSKDRTREWFVESLAIAREKHLCSGRFEGGGRIVAAGFVAGGSGGGIRTSEID